jgi:Arc/MetJ family transcription regulator
VKTTVDIPEKLLKEAMHFAKTSTKRGAVLAALEDYTHCHRLAGIVALFGKSNGFYTDRQLRRMRAAH